MRYCLDHEQSAVAYISLEDDRLKGFWWTDELAAVLAQEAAKTGSMLGAHTPAE